MNAPFCPVESAKHQALSLAPHGPTTLGLPRISERLWGVAKRRAWSQKKVVMHFSA